LSEELSASGHLLYETRRELLEAKKMFHNLSKAEIGIQECLRALNLAQTAQLHINDRSFADALRQIDELERTQLRLIEGYGFAGRLRAWIPVQVNKIRDCAAKDMQDWLATVRARSELLGQQALGEAQHRLENPTEEGSLGNLAEVEFEGLLASHHLFELMGRRKEFLSLLCEGRRQQLAILLEAQPISVKDPELRSFQILLENLAGFFTVEYYLTLLPQDVYSLPFVETLWDQAVARIQTAVDDATNLALPSAQQQQRFLLQLKQSLAYFLGACQTFPFSSTRLSETIDALFYRFVELLKEQFGSSIEENIGGDSLELFVINSTELFDQLRESFVFLRDLKFDSATIFPFTMSVVDLYQTVDKFITMFRDFLDGIRQRTGELDDIARKAVDSYLLCEANRLFLERSEGSVDLRQLVALYLNFDSLEHISSDISALLSVRPMRLHAVQMFSDSKTKVIVVIQSRLRTSINGVMHAYKSLNRLPESKPVGPSKPITDIVAFVTQTRTLLGESLDNTTFELVFVFLFKALADGLISCLSDPSVPVMNLEYIMGVQSDLQHLLEALHHHALDLSIFDPLSELLELALSRSCHDFMDPMVRQRSYGHLTPQLVTAFLSKVDPKAQAKRSSIDDLIMLLGNQTLS